MTSATALAPLLRLRTYLSSLFTSDSYYHLIEFLFFVLVIYLTVTRAYMPWNRRPLTPIQMSHKISQWKPQPLATPLPSDLTASLPLDLQIDGGGDVTVSVNGVEDVLNFASNNFLGLLKDPRVEQVCLDTMKAYGCGACGPRGFYGTTDVHLRTEEMLSEFCDTEQAILYSFGAATGNSTIPAFAKRGDLLVIDEALNYSLRLGVALSRANVKTFRHNDMSHLETILKQVTEDDRHDPSKHNTQRRIIVVEGIYQNYGDLCPFDQVVALKDKYLFRVMIDESFSLGVLGHGKGALKHFDIPRENVDIATADLGNAVASVGGFCVGEYDVVNHQRLSGAGYCFSASQPPFLAAAATKSLQIIAEDGKILTGRLCENITTFRQTLSLPALRANGWYVDGHPQSPLMYIRSFDDTLSGAVFTRIQQKCLQKGVLIARPVYAPDEMPRPKECVKVTLTAAHSTTMVQRAANTLREVLLSDL